MRFEVTKCDFDGCNRVINNTYNLEPEWVNWGYVRGVGDVCPHHNYSMFLKPAEPSLLEKVVTQIYAPIVRQQLEDSLRLERFNEFLMKVNPNDKGQPYRPNRTITLNLRRD